MSTIAGRINFDGRPAEREAIARMLQVQNHRGPGRKEVWVDGNVALGHGALPLADHTPYPLRSADGRLTLVADARIDNREELARVLGIDLPPNEDGPLLLAAYQRWGADCAEKLRGDFAFVIWDAAEQRLFAARDPFGVRALFYHHAPGKHFVFSSEIKGLWQHADIEKKLDEIRLAESIQLVDTDVTRTMFEDVWAVEGAHVLVVEKGQKRTWRYWSMPDVPDWRGGTSDEAYADELLSRLTTSVERRMRGTDAVVVELSGGLDSSTLAVLARDVRRRQHGPPLDVLSLRYPDYPETDEGEYIAPVLETGHFVPHMMNGTNRTTLSEIEAVLQVMDDPSLVAGNHHQVWMRLALAKSHGMQVLMTGFDGDTIIGHGFERYHELASAGEWETFRREAVSFERHLREAGSGPDDQIYLDLPNALQTYGIGHLRRAAEHGDWLDFFRVLSGLHRHFGIPRGLMLRRFIRRLLVPHALLVKRQTARFETTPFVREDLAARTNLRERAAEVELNRLVWPQTPRRQQEKLLPSPFYLRTIEALDLYGSAFGIETRHPFLDRDLVEFCLSLPSGQRLRDGLTRVVLRNALKGVLPEKVRQRPGKTSFAVTTSRAMMERDREKVQAALENPGRISRYLRVEHIATVLQRPVEEWGQDAIRLGQFVTFSKWMEAQLSKWLE